MSGSASDHTKKAILKAAAEAVASLGIGAPVSDVAQRCGVSEALIFKYYPSKRKLYDTLYAEIVGGIHDTLCSALIMKENLHAQLLGAWSAAVDWGLEHPDHFAAMKILMISNNVTVELMDENNRKINDALRSIICRSDVRERTCVRECHFSSAFFNSIEFTVSNIFINPRMDDRLKDCGFKLFWNGFTSIFPAHPDGFCACKQAFPPSE